MACGYLGYYPLGVCPEANHAKNMEIFVDYSAALGYLGTKLGESFP